MIHAEKTIAYMSLIYYTESRISKAESWDDGRGIHQGQHLCQREV